MCDEVKGACSISGLKLIEPQCEAFDEAPAWLEALVVVVLVVGEKLQAI
jgi:hypothetical protein